jgi:hypothetical protein
MVVHVVHEATVADDWSDGVYGDSAGLKIQECRCRSLKESLEGSYFNGSGDSYTEHGL